MHAILKKMIIVKRGIATPPVTGLPKTKTNEETVVTRVPAVLVR
jgi:hypothetical protein